VNKPRIRGRYFGIVIILSLLFLVPLNVYAQDSSAIAIVTPLPTIIQDKSAANNIIVSGKNMGLPNSSNLSLNDTQKGTLHDNEQFFITDSRTGQKYVRDQVIVRLKSQKNAVSSVSHEKLSLTHTKLGAKVEKEFSRGGVTWLQVVQLPNGTDIQSAVKEYEANPDVLYAEPDYRISIIPDQTRSINNYIISANNFSIPNDSLFSNQWDFHNTGQTGGTPDADIDAPEAWAISTGSDNIVVAVIDTGVLYTHIDLSSNIWNNTGEIPDNGIDDDGNGYIDDIRGWDFVNRDNDPIDDKDHGTHVSGTIGAVGNNTLGVAGVNWQVKIMPLKVFDRLGYGSTSDAILAVQYANAKGASVISNSWGGPDYSQALKDAIDGSPAVVVCAAGNGNGNNNDNYDNNTVYPASYTSTNIISVAATDHNDTLALYSNIGLNSVDLAAPGTSILSTYYDGNYAYMTGTSMATPHVSGVAALVKAVNPSLTSEQIKNIILSTVDVKSSLSGKVASGGRLNAYKAVSAALPNANFTSNVTSGTAPLPVKFNDTSTGVGISAWEWDFNNDTIIDSRYQNPEYTYFLPGNYTVNLTVTTNGRRDSRVKTGYISVATNMKSDISVFRNGMWYLDMNNNGVYDGGVDTVYSFGAPGWTPVVGDWNATGHTNIGVTNGQQWYLDWNGNGSFNSVTDRMYSFGAPGWTPLVGDWNNDGKTDIGVTNSQQWYLDMNNNGVYDGGVDMVYSFGAPGWTPVVGDWNATGHTNIGVTNGQQWYLDWNGDGSFNSVTDRMYSFGAPGWTPVVGDWNATGYTNIGVTNGQQWYLDWNGNGTWDGALVDRSYIFGSPTWTSVVGDWNGDGKGTKIGVYKDGVWYLDWNGSGVWDAGIDRMYDFGAPGWIPVIGKWG